MFIAACLIGCSSEDSKNESQLDEIELIDSTIEGPNMVDTLVPYMDTMLVDSTFINSPEITFFEGFPEKIDGCSCYFSFTEKDLEEWKFIYVDDYHFEFGFISINGELIELDLKNPANNEYSVEFEIEKEEQTGYEVHTQRGFMRITGPANEQYEAQYVGECGC